MAAAPELKAAPGEREATRMWLKIGCLGFGGPAGQIALMHRLIVEEKRWIDEAGFLHALNFCMLLPGPEAQQLATYLGWRLGGYRGGLVAGLLFILPGLCVIWILSALYAYHRNSDLTAGIFYGLKAAILAIVIEALIRLGRRALKTRRHILIAGGAFLALAIFGLPFPLVILAAAILGQIGAGKAKPAPGETAHQPKSSSFWRKLAFGLAIWLGPIAALIFIFGPDHLWSALGLFFAKMAIVTFGGAYAVLAYVAQTVVADYRWLDIKAMIDGLALAETTPGPLILVLSYVGFLAGFDHPGTWPPLLAGSFGLLIVTFVTFAPCFLWIFLGAPYVESWRTRPRLAGALAGVTAAAVGVIANLAAWFALHTLFRETTEIAWGWLRILAPIPASLDAMALLLALCAAFALLRLRIGLVKLLPAAAILGWLALRNGGS